MTNALYTILFFLFVGGGIPITHLALLHLSRGRRRQLTEVLPLTMETRAPFAHPYRSPASVKSRPWPACPCCGSHLRLLPMDGIAAEEIDAASFLLLRCSDDGCVGGLFGMRPEDCRRRRMLP